MWRSHLSMIDRSLSWCGIVIYTTYIPCIRGSLEKRLVFAFGLAILSLLLFLNWALAESNLLFSFLKARRSFTKSIHTPFKKSVSSTFVVYFRPFQDKRLYYYLYPFQLAYENRWWVVSWVDRRCIRFVYASQSLLLFSKLINQRF